MKMAELLRQLADKLDSIEHGKTSAPYVGDPNAANKEKDLPEPNNKNFMPPNQTKIELLKKGVGVESEFDDSDNEINMLKTVV